MSLILSWLSVALTLILILLFLVRKLVEKRNPKPGSALAVTYDIMRKMHIAIGTLVIPVVFCHCRIAGNTTGERTIFGAVLLVLLILLALSYFLRKPLGKYWKRLHQVLSAILTAVMAYHCLFEF